MSVDSPDIERDPLEELAAEFTERWRRGEQPSVEAYAARHPAMADDIRELFTMIRDVEQAKESMSGSGEGRERTSPTIEQLGDFRIIRELGRGGMGIVYEAEQESLGRRVAIKMLPHHYVASPKRRERFEREARTAARLHHTSIVPIFGVGEQDGYPYFVMQYIRGVGLDVVFRRLFDENLTRSGSAAGVSPGEGRFDFGSVAADLLASTSASGSHMISTAPAREHAGLPHENPSGLSRPLTPRYWRSLAELIAQVADALAYAHAQGVLHRDIKPSNLLLDSDGAVWVTDFGLAKTLEQDNITQAGDVVGTLRYMAPEQFAHKGDHRSDVYGLGVTLYELATLQPAFTDSRGSSVSKVLDPTLWPARRLCPTLPRDLETIIEKATAREVQHRYGSAAELRDDLRRFVEDRPIHARRISWTERFWRWSRRNPALAVSSTAAALLLLAVASVSSSAYVHVRSANLRTQAALTGEQQQRSRAEATADLAVESLDTLFSEFATENGQGPGALKLDGSDSETVSVAVPPVLSKDTARLLTHMLEFYRRLAHQEGQSRGLQLKMAAAQRRVGEIHERLGQFADAKTAYGEAIRQYEQLIAAPGGDDDMLLSLCQLHEQLGQVLFSEDRIPESTVEFEKARTWLGRCSDIFRRQPEVRLELARVHFLLARSPGADMPMAGPGGGPGRQPMAGGGPRRLPGPPMGQADDRAGPRGDANNAPPFGDGNGRPPRGEGPGRRDRPLGAGDERGRRPGMGNGPPGVSSLPMNDPEHAVRRAHLDEAVAMLRGLTGESPDAPAYRLLLAQCLRERGTAPGRPVEPGRESDEAITLLEGLVGEFPESPQYVLELCDAYANRPPGPGSRQKVESAVEMMETLTRERPGIPSYTFLLARLYQRLSQFAMRDGNPRTAGENLERSLTLQRSLVEQSPDVEPYVIATAFYEVNLARMRAGEQQPDAARTLLLSALRRVEPLAGGTLIKPHVFHVLMMTYHELGDVLEDSGQPEQARDIRTKAAALRGALPASRPAL